MEIKKDYSTLRGDYQLMLPMNTEILIEADDPVRLLKAVMEGLNYSKLEAEYSQRGRIGYSPRKLFQILTYANMRLICGTRKIEQACRENIKFMYLLEGEKAPDHNTIARFRKHYLPEAIEDLMAQLVNRLIELGEISLAEGAVFVDGTKIEANANRYSFVWKKSTIKSREKMQTKMKKELPPMLDDLGIRYHIPEEIKAHWLKKLRKRLYKLKKHGKRNLSAGRDIEKLCCKKQWKLWRNG